MSMFDIFKKKKETGAGVDELVTVARKLAKNEILIKVTDGVPSAEQSKFGGLPYLPADFEWPTYTSRDDGETRQPVRHRNRTRVFLPDKSYRGQRL